MAGPDVDQQRWRRLLRSDPAAATDLVRAAYVAVLEREPDAGGLRSHTQQVRNGLPVELLLAELARARDAEQTAARVAEREARADASAERIDMAAERVEAMDARLTHVEELVAGQRRTLLALSRRLAVLEDRRLSELAAQDTDPSPHDAP